jgi:copper(I)-binding protein
MKTFRLPALATILVLAFLAPACAKQPTAAAACVPVVRDGWIRLVPGMESMQAGFGRIENHCSTPATIIGARSPAHASAEMHETKIIDGVNRMRPVPQLRIAPEDAAVLKPGGLHLMLMDARAPLKAGSKVAIEFPLQDGRVVRGEFVVRAPGE